MILELKDKLKLEDAFEMKLAHQQEEAAEGASDLRDSRQEAVEALVCIRIQFCRCPSCSTKGTGRCAGR